MRIYEASHDETIVDWQWFEPSLRNITHLVIKHSDRGGGRALDVGCGTGRVAFRLAERGYTVDGVDIEPRVVDLANEIAERRRAKCSFRLGDFRDPHVVSPACYDLAVCSEVLEHVEEYQPIVENMYASLKPGGRLIITVPYDMKKFSVLDTYGGHVRRFELEEILQSLSRFDIREIIITGFPFYRLMVRTYLLLIKLGGRQHSNEELWHKRSTRVISHLAYPFMRLDNLFAFTRLGDALIAVADKPAA
jgi:SAM-dependent methyltransferase